MSSPLRVAAVLLATAFLSSAHAAPPAVRLLPAPLSPYAAGGPEDVEARCDFNADGLLDLLSVERDGVKIRFGQTGGTFASGTVGFSFPVSPNNTSVAAGNFNGDARADIAATASGTVRIINNLAGTGGAPNLVAGATLSVSGITLREVEAADLNGDGLSDIVALGDGPNGGGFTEGKVVIFLNSAGGFGAGTALPSPGGSATRVAIGDIDGNGALDLAVVVRSDSAIAVYMGTTPGSFAAPVLRTLGFEEVPAAVALGQLMGDSQLEMAVWRQSPVSDPPNSFLIGYTVYRHTGSGAFTATTGLGVSPHPDNQLKSGDIAIGDFNLDGQNDVLFTDPVRNELYFNNLALDGSGNIDGFASGSTTILMLNLPLRFSVANLNGDTATVNGQTVPKLDVAVAISPVNGDRSIDVLVSGSGGGPGGTTLPRPALTVTKPATGAWSFRATVATPLPAGASLKVQYTATPSDPGSWIDIPGGVMSAAANRRVFSFATQNLPTGNIAFRVIASDSAGSTPGISAASRVFPIVRRLDTNIAAVVRPKPLAIAAKKGANVIYDGNNIAKVTCRVAGDQGDFTWFLISTVNTGDVVEQANISGPGTTGGYLVNYFTTDMMDITPQVTAGTVSHALVRGAQFQFLMRVRVGANIAKSTVMNWDIQATSAADANTKDRSRAEIQVDQPANVYFVTTTADNGDTLNPTPGSLRAAIGSAVRNVRHVSTIKFELPFGASQLTTIPVSTDLPPLFVASRTVIDGYSQAEYREAATGQPVQRPAVELRGSGGGIGLNIQTNSCTVRGLYISNFGTGLQITGLNAVGTRVPATLNKVIGCVFEGNSATGVFVTERAYGNQIGDSGAGEGNVFLSTLVSPGNVRGNHGVKISGKGTDRNQVQGNILGSLADAPSITGADTSRGFNFAAISVDGGSLSSLIGGAKAGEGNYIAGNRGGEQQGQFARGLELLGTGTNGHLVQGNTFGRTSTELRANLGDNVVIDLGASRNIIGGTLTGRGNTIQNCFGAGVAIRSTNNTVCDRNLIQGNKIGGFVPEEGNDKAGVVISPKATVTYVGGDTPGAGNLILGNGGGDDDGAGVVLIGTQGNFVYGNYIGCDANNTVRGNRRGIHLVGTTESFIGSVGPRAGNTVSGNFNEGIMLTDAKNCSIRGNRIGVSASGDEAVPNQGSGIVLRGASNSNKIGDVSGGGNNIQANVGKGIRVEGTSTGNAIRGNNHGPASLSGPIPIDLVGGTEFADGSTQNDTGDADTGPNSLQNSPRITDIDAGLRATKITVQYNTTPRSGSGSVIGAGPLYVFDVYANGAYVGSVPFTTDPQGDPVSVRAPATFNGDGSFIITIPRNLVGKTVNLTATPQTAAFVAIIDGSTSEFSNFAIDGGAN